VLVGWVGFGWWDSASERSNFCLLLRSQRSAAPHITARRISALCLRLPKGGGHIIPLFSTTLGQPRTKLSRIPLPSPLLHRRIPVLESLICGRNKRGASKPRQASLSCHAALSGGTGRRERRAGAMGGIGASRLTMKKRRSCNSAPAATVTPAKALGPRLAMWITTRG